MIVVSNSSPLITLARVRCIALLPKLFSKVCISREVYGEVVVDGAGLPGADEVGQANWIEVRPVRDVAGLAAACVRTGLGAGEVSAIFLAKELPTDLVLLDEQRARRFAQEEGLTVAGCIGILEDLFERGELKDPRTAYQELIRHKARIDLQTLQSSLGKFDLRPL